MNSTFFTRRGSLLAVCVFIFVFLPLGIHPSIGSASRLADSVVSNINPTSGANNANLPVSIQGSGFTAGTIVKLGSKTLASTLVSDTQLNAVVPWGLAPGGYNLSVTNPGQTSPSVLPNAFTVTSGIGAWINNGPFGGNVVDLVYQPGSPSRLYACVQDAGLFVSTDEGATWSILINNSFPMRLMISPANPQVLYLNTTHSYLKSLDGGATWNELTPNPSSPYGNLPGTWLAFPHPTDPARVFITNHPSTHNYNEGGDGGIWVSNDYGETLQTLDNTGLTDKRITELIFDPYSENNHQTLLAGTIAGLIFQTTDGGATWTQKANLHQDTDQNPARIDRFVFNPSGSKEPWVVKRNPFMDTDWPIYYRASADRNTWSGVMVIDNPQGGPHPWFWMKPRGLTITTSKIWSAYDTGFTSSNATNLSWSALNPAGIPDENWRNFQFTLFAIDPGNPNKIFGGTDQHGVYKSTDGGSTWSEANHGLNGVTPYALAVSPHNLDEIYAISQTDGVTKSLDGGQHWMHLNFLRQGIPWSQTSIMVDRHDPKVIYLGMSCNKTGGSDACIHISRDGGQTWTDEILTAPPAADIKNGEVFAIASDPKTPGRVIAGATFFPSTWNWEITHPIGAIYYSLDYGETWTRSSIDPTLMKGSYSIAFDRGDSALVYAATDGSGLWRSSDNGVTWSRVSWTGCAQPSDPNLSVIIRSVATHPKNTGEVYAYCIISAYEQPPQSDGLFRSIDGGNTWTQVQTPTGGWATSMFMEKAPDGNTLYAGTWNGASLSRDQGSTWEPISGMPNATVYALVGATDSERAVVYSSTTSGLQSTSPQPGSISRQAQKNLLANQVLLAGGTYGFTMRMPVPVAYFPCILSNH